LVERAGSLFLFAATAVKLIDSSVFLLQQQLDVILGGGSEVSNDA
jgi:hypothetical protein